MHVRRFYLPDWAPAPALAPPPALGPAPAPKPEVLAFLRGIFAGVGKLLMDGCEKNGEGLDFAGSAAQEVAEGGYHLKKN